MHNHVDHRWIKAFLRKIISVILVYSLFFTNTAHASVGGWTLGNPIAQGASAIVNGTKTAVINGANVIKNSTAKITPPASAVAKVLARGAAGYALSVAVEQLLGSVDWVLDPANNRIVYTEPNPTNIPKIWVVSGAAFDCNSKTPLTGDISSAWAKCMEKQTNVKPKGCTQVSPTQYNCFYQRTWVSENDRISIPVVLVNNPAYDPSIEQEEKYLPLPTVAQKVISNAQNGDTQAQVATVAAAQDIINEAETDNTKARPIVNQLEANAETATDETATGEAAPKADPVTGEQAPPLDLSLEFPKFCTWAPTICEAAQVVLTFPNTLTEWWETSKSKAEEWALSISEAWTAAKEWAKNDENEDTDNDPPEIQEIDIGALDTSTFKGVAGCPAPIQVPITFGTGGETEISYEPICQLADKWSFVAPLIGFLSGAMILVGVGRKGEDGEI